MTALLFGLLFKIVLTVGIVVAASVVIERSGPFIGSLVASLPTAGGAALIILALEHPPQFIATSAVGSIVSNAVCAVFALAYAALAQHHRLGVSLAGALAVWFVLAFLTSLVEWTAMRAVAFDAIVFPLAIVAGRRYRAVASTKGSVRLTARDLAWRAGVVTLVVLVVTAASYSIGSFVSGLFAFFPVAMSSFLVILHSRIGGAVAASTAAHVQAPLIGLALGLLVVHLITVPVGVWWSYLAGLGVGVAWNGMLWALRNRALRMKVAR
jgi:uncharacterized membrane protein (GlpM family)